VPAATRRILTSFLGCLAQVEVFAATALVLGLLLRPWIGIGLALLTWPLTGHVVRSPRVAHLLGAVVALMAVAPFDLYLGRYAWDSANLWYDERTCGHAFDAAAWRRVSAVVSPPT